MEQLENDEFGYQDWIWHVRHGFVLISRAGSPERTSLPDLPCYRLPKRSLRQTIR